MIGQDEIFKLVQSASKFSASKKCFGEDIISSSELDFIRTIASYEKCNMKELAEALNVSSPACSQQIEKLVGKQYVERIQNPDDRRGVQLMLTDSGQRVIMNFNKCKASLAGAISRKLKNYDKDLCHAVIEAITATLNDKMKNYLP